MDYDVYMALHEEAQCGWVWFKKPHLPSRSLVRIKHGDRSVTCECRMLDDRDVAYYNDETHGKRKIGPTAYEDVLIMSDWYRTALRIRAAQSAKLEIKHLGDRSWYAFRAGCQNPDPMVRLTTRLGVLGLWLGVGGLVFAIVPAIGGDNHAFVSQLNLAVSGLLVILGVILSWACRGINRNP